MKFSGRDALLRVRDSKPNTDAVHRVPTKPVFFESSPLRAVRLLKSVNQPLRSRLGVSHERQYHEDPYERNEACGYQDGLEGV